MTTEKIMILDTEQIDRRIKRIAYEIYERNFDQDELVFAGVAGTGFAFAQGLVRVFEKVSGRKASLYELRLDKRNPEDSGVESELTGISLEGKGIVVVDDVLNSGKTLLHALKPFLDAKANKIETAVLVNRRHHSFPVAATYSGHELATTMNDHIEVEFSEQKREAYLQ